MELPAGRLGDEEDRLVLQRRAAREVSGRRWHGVVSCVGRLWLDRALFYQTRRRS